MSKWPYVAGILDGEGSIHAHRSSGHLAIKITIVGTDIRLMKWLLGNFGGKFYSRTKKTSGGRTAYYWMPSGKKNRTNFLLGILPYLLLKREQAILALQFLQLEGICPDKRTVLLDKISDLNHKDVSVETNTLDSSLDEKIESALIGDNECALVVTQEA